ncbi:hypothetical protein BS47DRAFT_1397046 [Hydnum rufescens UP504]|uniref:malate dehydrogenase n=1 Tax=Hydnum rufescens UP504 TaxID=1448309 RepID=A0A9P6DS95_9AGAM|nr:hypothetical protein BS47DRAFT_1397046 [Hydnum rufescens UP504]
MSHVATAGEVNGYILEKLGNALQGTKIVIIAAGVPWKPNIARVDLFNTNAPIVWDLAQAVGEDTPEAHILITSDPMNSTVSIITEVLKKASKFNPAKGVITPSFVKSPLYESEGVIQKDSPRFTCWASFPPRRRNVIQAALPELKKNIEKGVNFLALRTRFDFYQPVCELYNQIIARASRVKAT